MADSPIFQVTTPGEREIVVTRVLDAPRRLVFDALTKPELLNKEIFDEDWTGGETIVTTTFVEKAGKTILTITVLYSSREARDGALKTGMTEGMKAGYDKLAQVLAENQGKPS